MTLPPLKTDDGKRATVYRVAVEFDVVTIALVTDGAGAYVELETTDTDKPLRINPSELHDLAKWAKAACDELDNHNVEGL